MQNVFLNCLESTTLHGFPNVIRSKHFLQKLIWLLITLTSCATCVLFLYNTIIDYLSYPVVTSIENYYEQPMQFPAITICSRDHSFNNMNLSDLVRGCNFGYKSCMPPENYTTYFITSSFGKCYRFNTGKDQFGNDVPIFNSVIGGLDDLFYLRINSSLGLSIWIHNQTSWPQIVENNDHSKRIYVANGFNTNLVINKIINQKPGKPYSDCIKNPNDYDSDKTIINYLISVNEEYSKIRCLELCFEAFYMITNPCNCSNNTLGNLWNTCYAWNNLISQKNCIMDQKKIFYTYQMDDNCDDYCPLECDSITYNIETSTANNFKNLTYVYVYYEKLEYTLVRQNAKYNISYLVSQIGGVFSLFLGTSLLSFFELFHLLTEIIRHFFEEAKISKNKKIKVVSTN